MNTESQNIEFKQLWRDEYLKWICGFANAQGGTIGVSESDLMFQDIVEGNIIQMTERVIELLRSKYLISNIHYEGLQRVERLEIPEDALRELINNAICHKDYMGVAIQMKVYNDRTEHFSIIYYGHFSS